jgi:hypothetical protein
MQSSFLAARLFEQKILDKLEQPESTTAAAALIAKTKANTALSDKEVQDVVKQENLRLLFAIIFRQPSRLISECVNSGKHRDLLSASWPPEFYIIGSANSMPILSIEDKISKSHLLKSRLTRLYENEFSIASAKRGFEALYRNLAANIKLYLTEKHAMFTSKLFELLADVSATMRSEACMTFDHTDDNFVCTIEYLKSQKPNVVLPSPQPQSPERSLVPSTTSTPSSTTKSTSSCFHKVYLETPRESLEAAELDEEDLCSHEMKLHMMITTMNCHRVYKGDPILSVVENVTEPTGKQDGAENRKDEDENDGKRPNVTTRSSARRGKRKRDEVDSLLSSEENSTIADEPTEALKAPNAKRTKTASEKTTTTPLPVRERSKRRQSTRNG